MRRPARSVRRLALAVAATTLPLASFAYPSPASAAVAAQCTNFVTPPPRAVGGVLLRTGTVTGCTPVSGTGGSGTSVTNLNRKVSTITWAGGNGTTVVRLTYRAGAAANSCPPGSHLTIIGGRVVGGSGTARHVIRSGDAFSAHWCVTPKLAVSLEPGTVQAFNTAAGTSHGNPPPPAVPLAKGLAECPANTSSAVVTLANRDRKRVANAPPLKESANLDWAARKHAIAMAVKGYSFHDGWDIEIRDSGFVVGSPGWTGQNVGWMIAPFDPKLIESGYFDERPPEDGHRLNILQINYHYVGIGCVIRKANGAIFTAEDFGS